MFGFETYTQDRPLFAALGLRSFVGDTRDNATRGNDGWIDCGTVSYRPDPDGETWATIKVEVYCAPAMFWRFTIEPSAEVPDVQAGVIETGSGAFIRYWPIVEAWASGVAKFEAVAA